MENRSTARPSRKRYAVAGAAIVVSIVVGALGANTMLARPLQVSAPSHQDSTSYRREVGRIVDHHQVNETLVPRATAADLRQAGRTRQAFDRWQAQQDAQNAAHAATARNAPRGQHALPLPKAGITTPATVASASFVTTNFGGIAGPGSYPSDMALAASSSYVMQGVNGEVTAYDTAGTTQSGWPKGTQTFFGVPNPPNGCAGDPSLADPRMFYDPNDNRFCAAVHQ